MKESIYRYMKIGLIHPMAYPQTGKSQIKETIKKIAADSYFNAIEITQINDSQTRKEVKRILNSAHMSIGFAGHPLLLTQGLNINDLNEEGRKKAVDTLKEGIDEAYEIGAKGFAFLSGKYEEATKESSYKALLASTKELCEYAKSKGDIKVILEVFDYDIDKKSIIGPAPLAKRFAEDVNKEYDNFGLMVDLSHVPMIHETCEESILPIKDYLVHAHMGNTVIKSPECEAYGDMHPRFGFPNSENDVDELVEYLRVLLDIGFLNKENPPIVSFEVKPWKDEDSDIVIANAKRTLNKAWVRV